LEKEFMKLKIEFGREARFDKPVRETVPAPVKWPPNFRVLLLEAARAERPGPGARRADWSQPAFAEPEVLMRAPKSHDA
jgi:hypothetical protein